MNIKLLVIGKTDDKYLQTGIEKYQKRLKHYIRYSFEIIPDIKNKHQQHVLKQKESEQILIKTAKNDFVVLLDENGKEHTSVGFARFLEKKMLGGCRSLVFVVGGAYGFSEAVYQRANAKLSLSKLTFSHQMVRLIFIEQLYRAMTILKNEPYHHQ